MRQVLAAPVVFLDTSVLCNLLAVPGCAQDHDGVRSEFEQRVASGARFVLPITTLIETGNHIAKTAGNRRAAAERFARMIEQILVDTAPWRLNRVEGTQQGDVPLLDGDSTARV